MTSRSRVQQRIVAVALTAGAAALVPVGAEACTFVAPECTRGRFSPGQGQHLPANARGIGFWPSSGPSNLTPSEVDAPSIRSPDGGSVPYTRDHDAYGALLVPTDPLFPGAYTLVRREICASDQTFISDGGTDVAEWIAVGDPAELPEQSGTLRLLRTAIEDVAPRSALGCSNVVRAFVADLEFVPHPAVMPWVSVLALETSVGGVASGSSAFRQHDGTYRVRIEAACEPAKADVATAPLGVHEVKLQVKLRGMPHTPEPATLPLELTCGGGTAPGWANGAGCTSTGAGVSGWMAGALAALLTLRRRSRRH